MLAHIIGIPLEETMLSLAPVALAGGGMAGVKLRRRLIRRRPHRPTISRGQR